jgi:hypothetical protein
MSRSFNFQFKDFAAVIRTTPINVRIAVISLAIGGNFFYALGTKKEANILISKKYKFDRNGFTEFMIIDENGKHYNVNNSLWYWKWNSIEDWHRLKIHKTINVQYYGIRYPFLGLFPNIVSINPVLKKSYNEIRAEAIHKHLLEKSKEKDIHDQPPSEHVF